MSPEGLTELILQYRYWILIPLSFIEGPLVAFVAGTLAAVGIFNIYLLGLLFFVRDIILDAFYYAIGYYWGRTPFATRMLAKLRITPDHLAQARSLWERRPMVTMFVGKLAYGIASAFIVAVGMMRMPFGLFLKYGIIVAIVEYGGFLALGYFLGASFGGDIVQIVKKLEYVLAFGAVAVVAYLFFSFRMRSSLLKADEKIEALPPDPESERLQ
jgi:membrane protein DedA with SNARE-associated domain